jgi:glutathione S-transferase
MPIDLYYVLASPPCRSVLLLAKALKIELNLKVTDLPIGDNRTPEFLKVSKVKLSL